MVYHGISHESLQSFASVNTKLAKKVQVSDKGDIPWYYTRERCITLLYHAIENVAANTINVTYAWCIMGRFDVIPSNIRI